MSRLNSKDAELDHYGVRTAREWLNSSSEEIELNLTLAAKSAQRHPDFGEIGVILFVFVLLVHRDEIQRVQRVYPIWKKVLEATIHFSNRSQAQGVPASSIELVALINRFKERVLPHLEKIPVVEETS